MTALNMQTSTQLPVDIRNLEDVSTAHIGHVSPVPSAVQNMSISFVSLSLGSHQDSLKRMRTLSADTFLKLRKTFLRFKPNIPDEPTANLSEQPGWIQLCSNYKTRRSHQDRQCGTPQIFFDELSVSGYQL